MIVSFVLPVFNCEGNIGPLFEELQSVSAAFPMYQPEYIFVDDHSTDGSMAELQSLNSQHLKIVGLNKNVGAYSAILRGLEHVSGARVIVMAADGQDDPVVAFNLIGMSDSAGMSAAFRTSTTNALFGRIFHNLMTKINDQKDSERVLDMVVFPSELIPKILLDPRCKAHLFYGLDVMIRSKLLFSHEKRPRKQGHSGWTTGKKIHLAMHTLWVFSIAKLKSLL